jgi:hypothetical protein
MIKSPLVLFFIASLFKIHLCFAADKRDVTIQLQPNFGGKPLVLSTHTYVSSQGDTLSIDRMRFYLSAFVLEMENGEKYSEPNSFHLIDAEESSSYSFVLKNVPAGKIVSMSFNIGIDSITSVSGAMGGDLDPVKGMYWAWNSGYINAKLEGRCRSFNGKKSEPFEFHIGGYMQPHYAIRSVTMNVREQLNTISLLPDIATWFNGWNKQQEKSIMIPGRAAMRVADRYSKMFIEN